MKSFFTFNQDQLLSFIRSAFKTAGAWLVMHGHAQTGNWLESTEVMGYATIALGFVWSHLHHSNTVQGIPTTPNLPGLKLLLCLGLLSPFALASCSGPGRAAYNSVSVPAITADAAMKAWGDYVAQNHPGVAAEKKVLAAYQKYRLLELTAIDAAHLAADTAGATNGVTLQGIIQTASTPEAGQALSDLIALIRSFGVPI